MQVGWQAFYIKDVAFSVCQQYVEARVHLMPGVQLIGWLLQSCIQLELLSGAVVSVKPLCSCGCWCFSCSSLDPGHINPDAGREKQEPVFGLSGGVAMRCSTLLGILTGVLLYLVLGAVVFRALETPREQGKHNQLQDTRRDFLLNFSCVAPDNLHVFIEVSTSSYDKRHWLWLSFWNVSCL